MTTTDPDLSPDPDEVLQVEAPEPTVRVKIEGPTRVQILPRTSGGIRGVTVGTTPVRLCVGDPHRAAAHILTDDVAVRIAGSQQELTGGQPGKLGAGKSFDWDVVDELWAMTETGTTTVTVVQKRWADG